MSLFSGKVVVEIKSGTFLLFSVHLLSELYSDELLVRSKASMLSFFFGRKAKFLMDLQYST